MEKQIEITNEEALKLLNAIRGMSSTQHPLPIKVWWANNANDKAVVEHVKNFEEARIELAKKCAEKDEKDEPKKDGNGNYSIKDTETFSKELTELLKVKVKMKIQMINSSDCGDFRVSGKENPLAGTFAEYCLNMEG